MAVILNQRIGDWDALVSKIPPFNKAGKLFTRSSAGMLQYAAISSLTKCTMLLGRTTAAGLYGGRALAMQVEHAFWVAFHLVCVSEYSKRGIGEFKLTVQSWQYTNSPR